VLGWFKLWPLSRLYIHLVSYLLLISETLSRRKRRPEYGSAHLHPLLRLRIYGALPLNGFMALCLSRGQLYCFLLFRNRALRCDTAEIKPAPVPCFKPFQFILQKRTSVRFISMLFCKCRCIFSIKLYTTLCSLPGDPSNTNTFFQLSRCSECIFFLEQFTDIRLVKEPVVVLPEDSSPYSKMSAIGIYPELHESSPHLYSLFSEIHFYSILPPMLASPRVPFP